MGLTINMKAGETSVRLQTKEGLVLGRVHVSPTRARTQTKVVYDFDPDIVLVHEEPNAPRPAIGTIARDWS